MEISAIIIAIITSFIASVVFYFFFQYIPERRRKNKIRPRVEVELMEVTDTLFFYIEFPFRYNIHFPSYCQKEIKTFETQQSDFQIGLYNKCLTEDYLFDENADKFIVVGKELQKYADQVTNKIQQIMMNQNYLSPEEILIIEDISRLLNVYSYDFCAISKIGNNIIRPVNPSISYMSENFYKIYLLWCEMRQIMYEYRYIKKEKRQGYKRYFQLQCELINYRIQQKEYVMANKLIEELSKQELSEYTKEVLEFYRLRINIEKGDITNSKKILVNILNNKNREKAVYLRGYMECIRDNAELMEVCSSLCTSDEISYWNNTVQKEKQMKDSFWEQNTRLKEYYDNKTK